MNAVMETYYLQEELLEVASDDGFAYEEVPVHESSVSSGEEDLETALHNLQIASQPVPLKQLSKTELGTSGHPEVVEDFLRNYLVKLGMKNTLNCFEAEWYELSRNGKLESHQLQHLPDIYSQNRKLEEKVECLKQDLLSYQNAARLAKEKYVRLKKECDYHRMHHRRVVQEKNKLISDIKRMKQHFSSYEPTLKQLKQKYENATREKMLASLERDRALSEVGCLQSTIHSLQPVEPQTEKSTFLAPSSKDQESPNVGPFKAQVKEISDSGNPYKNKQLPVCGHLTRTGGFQQTKAFQAHKYSVNSLCVHPKKELIVTASDDHCWKMWAISSGDLLMSAEGHSDWLSHADFHPLGLMLATTSGDGMVKVWDFQRGQCTMTFTDHQQPVWDCSWHWKGEFLATAAMDHCCKIWDVERGVCHSTLRGHVNSVNAVNFLPYSSTLCTCSADKTVSLWDTRSGLCVNTFYGHQHSCNDVICNFKGTSLFSTDCFGTVICWDIRAGVSQMKWDTGQQSINSLAIDPAGGVLACASSDGLVHLIDVGSKKEWLLEGHRDGVQAVCYSMQAESLFTAGSDGQVIAWQ